VPSVLFAGEILYPMRARCWCARARAIADRNRRA